MPNHLLSATKIHDGYRFLPAGSALEVAPDGSIAAIYNYTPEGAAHFEGVLCPGFVNAHCHLELSHMRNVIPRGTGLIPFLQSVVRQRTGFMDEQKEAARHEAYQELLQQGIVAVGDIANTTDTLDLRMMGKMHMHTFVECIGFTDSGASARLIAAAETKAVFEAQSSDGDVQLRQSLAPHAPYSVSPALLRLISEAEADALVSIHNQEGFAEDEYYRHKTGDVRNLLEGFAIDDRFFEATGKSSLQSYLPLLGEGHPLILVHNTCSSAEDVAFAQHREIKPFWCLCPNANLYIEDRLPDVDMIAAHTDRVCIGTDSLASNSRLSILAELQVLREAFPGIGWERLLHWATSGGARALMMGDLVGSFAVGMKPGVLHIPSLEGSAVNRLI
jgi:cytosine/adenosine deaminase-related metal-dependent hydrolase